MKRLLLALIVCCTFPSMALAAVNLNTATQEELEVVNGIGPKKAGAIIKHRNKNGPFKKVDDLKEVSGFGDKSVASMRAELTVEVAASAKADKKAEAKPALIETGKAGKSSPK